MMPTAGWLNGLHRFSIRRPRTVLLLAGLLTAAALPGMAWLRLRMDGQALGIRGRILKGSAGPILGLLVALASPAGGAEAPPPSLERLLGAAKAGRWDTLSMGESVARFARALEGAPYRERTLEGPGPEVCRVPTDGYDCVTFMELALNLARTVRADRGGRDPVPGDVVEAVTCTRYRGGRIAGFASRLHYTSEWIADNVARGVLEDVTPSLGGVDLPLRVDFLSAHPELYGALRGDPALTDSMRRIERRINSSRRTHVPRDRLAAIEPRLRSGDLVAIRTTIGGLDYSHTGIIVRDGGDARLLHASSRSGRVQLDGPIGRYLARGPRTNAGVSVLRPRDPRGP